MKSKFTVIILLSLTLSVSAGCSKIKKNLIQVPSKSNSETEPAAPVNNFIKEPNKKQAEFFAPFTGEEVDEKTYNNVPFMAIIENSKDARPQSGLVDADIVYETMAEGGIPRTIAIFQKNSPEKIGPIRSARSYFLNLSREYNLAFAHCGASDEADEMIQKNKLMSLNEFAYTGFYWRERDRKAPHNLYTSADRIRDAIVSRKYNKPVNVKFSFDKSFWNNNQNFKTAININLKLSKYYSTSYTYKDGKYYKSMNGTASLNKEDARPLAFTNIVIQATSIKQKKDSILVDITLTGQGDGYVISNGKYIKMKWSKKDLNSQTILTDENGTKIPLNPGNTWWNIIDKSDIVEIQ
ncbi:DUF3048 domain-containing protein [Clostridium sp. SYSU_GA19001]|uniref:DUF3048 domain-containing protein n=1 Tax=Clostridium caldaquaticum TaxID=2940653 RepID=UPI0020770984|nr:DUF3048 domain-containing protein [Clostridium caldaquaticum]MCM8710694.1 DUF3048 domain-containing protein [Clostridium caldaquaticum]